MVGVTGKYGRLASIIGGVQVNHEFSNWSITDTGDQVPMDGYEKTPNSLGQYRKNIEIGLVGGTVKFKGRWNTAKTPYAVFYVGREFNNGAALFCGITAAVGFTITGKVVAVTPSDELTSAADFEAEVFIEAIGFA